MLSVIIATRDSERALVRTLAALVPGATAGLISEVLVADGGSRDDTAIVADAAGCNFMSGQRSVGERLGSAATAVRGPWLLFLRPGTVLDPQWIGEASRFIEQPPAAAWAAVFRPDPGGRSPLRQILRGIAAGLAGTPSPDQGLLIAKQRYHAVGGHAAAAIDPEADLLRRIGRSRLALLSATASAPAG
jgi:glycosyltransferase involved in cell wall biosynthesis